MSTQDPALLAPLATVLPDPPPGEPLTSSQWATLLAIAETVIPSVRRTSQKVETGQLSLSDAEYDAVVGDIKTSVANPPDDAILANYLAEGATDYETFRRELRRTLGSNVRDDARKGLAFILDTFSSRLGSLICNGTWTPLHEMSIPDRAATLQRWSQSYLPPLRQASCALIQLCKMTWARTSPTLGPAIGFPRNPAHGKPGKGFDYEFIQIPPGSDPHVLETEVIIVGSGCGAGVAAKNLAEAGHDVLVVDKAYHYPPEYLPMSEMHGSQLLFEGGGLQAANDSSIALVAGSAWGGGGTVNWSVSLQTQGFVRREWADQGLDFFTSGDYQACLDRVCERMGVSTEHIEHNHGNHVLLEGSRRLGYSARPVPQNTGGAKHYCGHCTYGCGSAEKQGPAVSWLPDAARAGAKFMEGYEVQQVMFEETSQGKTAVGVKGVWTSRDKKTEREVIIRARKVVVSAGTVWSPIILIKSGLKNPNIGYNLKLHPVTIVLGVWPKEIKPWEGGIITSVCDEFQNLDGQGHGVKLECLAMMPSWLSSAVPGIGVDFKKLMLKAGQMNGYVSLVRDKDSGRIYPDPTGKPKIAYTPSATDRAHCLEGAMALAKICYVMGAEEIYISSGVKPYIRSERESSPTTGEDLQDVGVNNPAFQDWLVEVKATGLPLPGAVFGSAHQMGTCRMGIDEANSVVDPTGHVWGTQNLYVADASVFPSASGVNPMVTNMAISDWISRGIARELNADKGRSSTSKEA